MVVDLIPSNEDTLAISETYGKRLKYLHSLLTVIGSTFIHFRSDRAGNVQVNFEDSIVQLHPGSIGSILGRSIVIHRDEDDLGRSGFRDSRTTG